jgi:hypothetical protein
VRHRIEGTAVATIGPGDDIRIPPIAPPFPAGPGAGAGHPARALVEQQLADRLARVRDPHLCRLFCDIRLVEFAGRLYPECSPPGLLLASLFFALFTSHDGWARRREADGRLRSAEEVARTHLATLTALDGRHTGPHEPAFVRLAEWFGRCLAETADQETDRRFRRAFARCLDAHVWELDWRRRRTPPSMVGYPALRREVSGIPVIYTLHPLLFDIPLDAALFDHPAVDQLQTLSADYHAWARDLLSLRRELREKSRANLVLVLREELRCDLDQAIGRAVELMNRHTAAYLDLKVRLPHLGLSSVTLTALLDRQEAWSVDSIARHRLSRYQTTRP